MVADIPADAVHPGLDISPRVTTPCPLVLTDVAGHLITADARARALLRLPPGSSRIRGTLLGKVAATERRELRALLAGLCAGDRPPATGRSWRLADPGVAGLALRLAAIHRGRLAGEALLEWHLLGDGAAAGAGAGRRADDHRRRFLDIAPEGIWIVDREGRTEYVNQRLAELLGYSVAEMLGRPVFEFMDDEMRRESERRFDRRRRGVSEQFEFRYRRRDGTPLWAAVSSRPIRDARGEFAGSLGLLTPLPGPSPAPGAERRRVRSTAAVADPVPALVAYVGADLRYRFTSEGYERWFGLPGTAPLGRHVREVLGDEAYRILRPHLEAALAGREVTCELAIRCAGDVVREVRATYVPDAGPDGQVVGLVALLIDISEQKRAEEALRRSEEWFRLVSEMVPQLVWTTDAWGEFDWTNQRWVDYTGLGLEETKGWGWAAALHPDDRERAVQAWTAAVEGEAPYEIEYRLRRHDGVYRWFLGRARPLRDEPGRVVKWFGTCTDIDDQKRAEESLRFLSEASAALAGSLDLDGTLAAVARLAVPRLADWCAIDLLEPDGSLRRLAVVHTDPARVELARRLRDRYPPHPDDPGGPTLVVRTGASQLVAELSDEMLAAAARDAEHLELLRGLGLRSYLCVPLRSRGGVLGAVSLAMAESTRCFGPADRTVAEDLASRAAAALESARLHAAEAGARERAEEAVRRSAFLAEASTVLASSLDYEVTVAQVTRMVVATLADGCTVAIREGNGAIRHVAAAHADPEREPILRRMIERYPVDPGGRHPVARALRSGVLEAQARLTEADLADFATDAEHLALVRRLEPGAYMVFPLKSGGRTFGALCLWLTTPGRHFREADIALGHDLARRIAATIDNALLYREAREAARRERERAAQLRGLADVALRLNSTASIDELLRVVTDAARGIIGAHRAVASLTADASGPRTGSAVSLSEADAGPVSEPEPATDPVICALVSRENRPVRLTQAELEAHPAWRHGGVAAGRHRPARGWLAAPLTRRDGRYLGLVQLSDKLVGDFTADDEAILVQLAQMASVAIENTEYATTLERRVAERTARLQESTEQMEAFSYSVSHDLRAPLRAIQGFLEILAQDYGDRLDPAGREYIRRVTTATRHMDNLIRDLLAYSRLSRVDLPNEAVDLRALVAAAGAQLEPVLAERQATLTIELPPDLPPVLAHPATLFQAVSNLLANAVKFVAPGVRPRVEVGAALRPGGWVRLWVADNGIGIEPRYHERIFGVFERLHGGERYPGTGVGLAIVKKGVERMRGRLGLESAPGQGSRFWLELRAAG